MTTLTETDVERDALDWRSGLGWQVVDGPDIAPETPNAERDGYGHVVLDLRLRDALATPNSALPASALDHAFCELTRPQGATLEARNRVSHQLRTTRFEYHGRPSHDSQRRLW